MHLHRLASLRDPQDGTAALSDIHALKLLRDGETLYDVKQVDLREDDDIQTGVIANLAAGHAFPISDFIACILSDEDMNGPHVTHMLQDEQDRYPNEFKQAIEATVGRLAAQEVTSSGDWNREEMDYYDAEVSTAERRAAFLKAMKTKPLWHIFLERKRHLTDHLSLSGKNVLEIGCGNARTISWIAKPDQNDFRYVGIDISWKRLLLAKQAVPEGDFIQASGLNLPFQDGSFDTAIAFGSLHHMPDPLVALEEGMRTVTQGGTFALQEPIIRPALVPENGFQWLRKTVAAYEHSDHDNEIDLNAFEAYCRSNGLKIEHRYTNVSPVRTLMALGKLQRLSIYSKQWMWKMIIKLDQAFLKTLGREGTRFGPSAVAMVVRKP